MLVFSCAGGDGVVWTKLETAEQQCVGRILVLDPNVLGLTSADPHPEIIEVQAIPPGAILNDGPYRSPKAVTAAGGFVVRRATQETDVLLIFRRGVWDLPKGKLDKGETVAECALREVREELGISDLQIRRPLGTTLHGYPDGPVFSVKTTYWFLMETREERFVPQAEEQIEEVAWVPWNEAKRRVGFDTLRDHMQRVEGEVRALYR